VASRGNTIVLSVACAVVGTFLAAISIPAIVSELRLRSAGAVVRAEVTAWRVHHGRFATSHEVQYAFHVSGTADAYTLRDRPPLRRANLWASIPEALWHATQASRALDVRFLPADPTTNRPEASRSALANAIVGTGAAALFFAFAWLPFWVERLRARASP
jgi:hypothetical protein